MNKTKVMATGYDPTKIRTTLLAGKLCVLGAFTVLLNNIRLKRHMADVLYIFASKTDKFF